MPNQCLVGVHSFLATTSLLIPAVMVTSIAPWLGRTARCHREEHRDVAISWRTIIL
jgi:hypothetical protein